MTFSTSPGGKPRHREGKGEGQNMQNHGELTPGGGVKGRNTKRPPGLPGGRYAHEEQSQPNNVDNSRDPGEEIMVTRKYSIHRLSVNKRLALHA